MLAPGSSVPGPPPLPRPRVLLSSAAGSWPRSPTRLPISPPRRHASNPGSQEGTWRACVVPTGSTSGLQYSKVGLELVRARERSGRVRPHVSRHSCVSVGELRLQLVARALGALGERSQPIGAAGLPAPVTSGLGSPRFSREPEPRLRNPGERGHHTAAWPRLPGSCQLVVRGRHLQA